MNVSYPKAILWDMDGVIVSSSHLHIQAWEQVLSERGIAYSRQTFNEIYGFKNSEFIRRLVLEPLDEQTINLIVYQKEVIFQQISNDQLQPLPGVEEWLKRFRKWGYKQAIASSGEPQNIEYVVDKLGIRGYFNTLVTPMNLPGKPDPAVFLKAANELNIYPPNCLVIEDSSPGIEAAGVAGMHCIAVCTTNPQENLSKADIVVESLDRLTEADVLSLFE